MEKVFNSIIKFSIFLLVFLLPLFWLPFSFEPFEFNKQYLLFFLVSLAFFSWIVKMVLVDKELRFKKTPLDVFVAVFIFVAILSAIFSVDKNSSVFGFYGRFSDGLISLASLGIFYFLVTNNVSLSGKPQINADKKLIDADKKIGINQPKSVLISGSGLVKTLLWSTFFVVLFSYFSIFGLWEKIPGLPEVMYQPTFNPVAGSLEGLAVFLGAIVVLLVGIILSKNLKIKSEKFFYWSLLIAGLGLLLIITQSSVFNFQLPTEQILGQGTSWGISLRAVTDNVKNGFLGSGIGTFFYDFAKFKPVEFNKSPLWQVRFDRAGSHISELLATMGFLGLLTYLGLVGMFLLISWFILGASSSKFQIPNLKSQTNSKSQIQNSKQLPLLIALVALLIAQFFYYQNTVLAFLFWLFLALSVVSWPPTTFREIRLAKPIAKKVLGGLLIIIGLGILMSYYFAQKFYRADMAYAKIRYERAVSLNPNLSQYRIILARDCLNEGLLELRKPLDEQDSNLLREKLTKAIDEARVAVLLSPNSIAGWETLGMVYRDIYPIVQGAGEWGVKTFEKAISLEPTNPILQTELGKLYLVLDETQKAKEAFGKAKELKPDYLDALLQEVLIDERENNLSEVIKKLEEVSKISPLNTDILFQLGRLYFNNNQMEEALSEFKKVLKIFPHHSDALYSLGVIWSQKGEKNLAIEAFEKCLQLNPGNQDVIQKLQQLKK